MNSTEESVQKLAAQQGQNQPQETAAGIKCLAIEPGQLNDLLRVGFVLPDDPANGLVVLVRGKPGTGKTTLSLQILEMLQRRKLPRCIISVEQSQVELARKLARMLVHRAIEQASNFDPKKKKLVCCPDELQKSFQNRGLTFNIDENVAAALDLSLCDDDVNNDAAQEEQKRRNEAIAQLVMTAVDQVSGLVTIRTRPEAVNPQTPSRLVEPFGENADSLSRLLCLVHLATAKTAASGECKGDSNNGHSDGEHGSHEDSRQNRPVVVVDGLSTLSRDEQRVMRLQSLVQHLRRKTQLAFIAYEPLEEEADLLSHQVDMVFELSERMIDKTMTYLIHELWIRKSRYQPAALGRHQFKIRDSGIEIYPSIHFQVHRPYYPAHEYKRSIHCPTEDRQKDETDRPPEKNASVLDMMLGNIAEGDSVAILGSRGTFKRELCRDFLIRGNWGCPRIGIETKDIKTENGLLISLLDTAKNIHCKPECPLYSDDNKQCHTCKKTGFAHVFTFHQRPGCITPAELMHHIKTRVRNEPLIKRVVFWDLTQIDYRFPLLMEDKMFIPGLLDLFHSNRIRSSFMGAGNASYTPAISAMADNVVFCWRVSLSATRLDKAKERLGSWLNESIQTICPAGDATKKEFLLAYVDRKASSIGQQAKPLYVFPVDEKGGVMFPRDMSELQDCEQKQDNWALFKAWPQIEKITKLQGVR